MAEPINASRTDLNEKQAEHEGCKKQERRIYAFQRALEPVLTLSSTSQCGVLPNLNANWDDTADLSLTESLPRISTRRFDIRCHIGVIIIDEHASSDSSLTLKEKLTRGLIFEHTGPDMSRASDAVGRHPKVETVKTFTALEFIGYTTLGNDELNALLQDIVRVDAALDQKPKYRPVYWNCHDIGVRFAYLATDVYASLEIARALSTRFESAKLNAQGILDVGWSAGTTMLRIPFTNLFAYIAIRDRKAWIAVLRQRYPQLGDLEVLTPQWENHERRYSPFWFVPGYY